MSSRATQIDSLTPLRGIAAILVILYHMSGILFLMKLGAMVRGTGFIDRGYLWVDFFFVLSGFIITHAYGVRLTENWTKQEVRDYLVARFSRLYPLHFVALCLSVLLYIGIFSKMPSSGEMSMASIYEWKALPFHFVWLIGFGLTGMTWNVPAWSIATEWWTYLLALPLFPHLNRGVSKRTFIVPVLCCTALFVLISRHPTRTLNITFDFGLLRCFLSFTVGMCLYQLYKVGFQQRALERDLALVGAGALTVLLLHFPNPAFTMPTSTAQMPVAHPLTPYFDAVSPLVFGFLILCAAYNRSGGHRVLNWRPLRYLGDISFSVYLMQVNAFVFFMIVAGGWRQRHPIGEMDAGTKVLVLSLTVLIDVLIAMATYRWVERPARGWLRRKLS